MRNCKCESRSNWLEERDFNRSYLAVLDRFTSSLADSTLSREFPPRSTQTSSHFYIPSAFLSELNVSQSNESCSHLALIFRLCACTFYRRRLEETRSTRKRKRSKNPPRVCTLSFRAFSFFLAAVDAARRRNAQRTFRFSFSLVDRVNAVERAETNLPFTATINTDSILFHAEFVSVNI